MECGAIFAMRTIPPAHVGGGDSVEKTWIVLVCFVVRFAAIRAEFYVIGVPFMRMGLRFGSELGIIVIPIF
jgi:hypothetical protein